MLSDLCLLPSNLASGKLQGTESARRLWQSASGSAPSHCADQAARCVDIHLSPAQPGLLSSARARSSDALEFDWGSPVMPVHTPESPYQCTPDADTFQPPSFVRATVLRCARAKQAG